MKNHIKSRQINRLKKRLLKESYCRYYFLNCDYLKIIKALNEKGKVTLWACRGMGRTYLVPYELSSFPIKEKIATLELIENKIKITAIW